MTKIVRDKWKNMLRAQQLITHITMQKIHLSSGIIPHNSNAKQPPQSCCTSETGNG